MDRPLIFYALFFKLAAGLGLSKPFDIRSHLKFGFEQRWEA